MRCTFVSIFATRLGVHMWLVSATGVHLLYNHNCLPYLAYNRVSTPLSKHAPYSLKGLFPLFFHPYWKRSAETKSCFASLARQKNHDSLQMEDPSPFMPCHNRGVCLKASSIPKRQ